MAQTTMRYAWIRARQIIGDGLSFWVDLTLEPATIAYALLLALVAAVLIGLLPALKATSASVQRGLQGITSTGGTMKFGGVWSFIIGARALRKRLWRSSLSDTETSGCATDSTSCPQEMVLDVTP